MAGSAEIFSIGLTRAVEQVTMLRFLFGIHPY